MINIPCRIGPIVFSPKQTEREQTKLGEPNDQEVKGGMGGTLMSAVGIGILIAAMESAPPGDNARK